MQFNLRLIKSYITVNATGIYQLQYCLSQCSYLLFRVENIVTQFFQGLTQELIYLYVNCMISIYGYLHRLVEL